MKTCKEKKTLLESMFNNFNNPDISFIGGIYLEQLIKLKNNSYKINTNIGGNSGKISLNIKKLGLYPSVFTFLGKDEYLNIILSHFETHDIPITWNINPNGTTKIIRIIDENKEYIENNEFELSINPIFLDEYLSRIDNIFINVESWNIDLIDFFNYKNKNIFLYTDKKEYFELLKNNHCYELLFFNSNLNDFINEKVEDNIIIFSKNKLLFKNQIYDLDEGLYYYEAIAAYQSIFLFNYMRNNEINTCHEKSLFYYNNVIKTGKF